MHAKADFLRIQPGTVAITDKFIKYNLLCQKLRAASSQLLAGAGLLLALGSAPTAQAQTTQPTFTCSDGKSYLFQNSPTDAYEVDLVAGTTERKTTTGLLGTTNLNAFGYDQASGYIWGQVNGQSNIVRIGSDYSAQSLAFTLPSGYSETTFVVGDVGTVTVTDAGTGTQTKKSTMYLTRGGSGVGTATTTYIYAIDLSGGTAPFPCTVISSPGGTYITDWAVSPIDGNLYAIYSTITNNGTQVNTSKLTLYRYLTKARTVGNTTTAAGTRETLGTVAGGSTPIAAANFGAVFMDSNGSFYVVANASGYIHRIDRPDQLSASSESTTIAATYITTGPAATTNNNDGARCANSRVTAILPVQLTAFTAAAAPNRQVQLSWTTASELHNAYFEVQHSLDGRTFATVAQVQGHGTSAQVNSYAYTDAAPGGAATHYYRLRQVDLDGTSTFSAARAVTLAAGSSATQLAVAPNPTTPAGLRVQVQYAGETTSPAVLTVRNLVGQAVLSQNVMLAPGSNEYVPSTTLAPGAYWLTLGGAAATGAPGVRVLVAE